MQGGCYVFYFYFYFALCTKIFSEKVRKPINKKIKGLVYYVIFVKEKTLILE